MGDTMNKQALGAATLAGLLTLALSGCNDGNAGEAVAEIEATPLPVAVGYPEIADIAARYETTGTLTTDAEAPVTARTAGDVVEILVEEGDAVSKGDVLARLDGERLRLTMLQLRAEFERSTREVERLANLHDRGLVSSAQYESLVYDARASKAAYELARLNWEHTEIRSTIDGVVSSRQVKLGSNLAEGDTAFVVTNDRELLAYLDIPQTELVKFRRGHVAQLSVDSDPGMSFDATVTRISPTINPTTGTFRATMLIDNEDRKLAPGMFARFQIAYETHADALVVPASATLVEDDVTVVYVVEDGAAVRRPVDTGIRSGDYIEILGGLSTGDTIVLRGQSRLRNGSRVLARAEPAEKPARG